MTKEITIQLTPEMDMMLKSFAETQRVGGKATNDTPYAIHFVQTKRHQFIPYVDELADHFHDLPLRFTMDTRRKIWQTDERDVVEKWFDLKGEPNKKAKSYQHLNDTMMVSTYEEYFEYYGLDDVQIAWKQTEWVNVAPFFTMTEAEIYVCQQEHNLVEPRIQTSGKGYANNGDYPQFWELLRLLGEKALEKELV